MLVEWQNVTAGYDLDALWNRRHLREGYAWIGVSAQRVGVDQLRAWSPTRYGSLDVTGGGAFTTDQLSYDIFAQAAEAVRSPGAVDLLGGLDVERVLAIGASQSAGRMTIYYNVVLPQEQPVFDGYAFIVGTAPTRVGTEPIFQVLSETDVTNPAHPPPRQRRLPPLGGRRRRALGLGGPGVPAAAVDPRPRRRAGVRVHEPAVQPHPAEPGDRGRVRAPRALGRRRGAAAVRAVPRVQRHHEGAQRARPRARRDPALAGGGADGAQHRVELRAVVLHPLRHARAVRTTTQLGELYRNHGQYVSAVAQTDEANVEAGFLLEADAEENQREAAQSGVGK